MCLLFAVAVLFYLFALVGSIFIKRMSLGEHPWGLYMNPLQMHGSAEVISTCIISL